MFSFSGVSWLGITSVSCMGAVDVSNFFIGGSLLSISGGIFDNLFWSTEDWKVWDDFSMCEESLP